MKKVSPPLKWHGGKHDLATWIIGLMPPRCTNPNDPDGSDPGWLHYVEPYFGGGSVLLANDPEGISEVVNDLHAELANFWTVLQNTPLFELFRRIIEATPFSEDEWNASRINPLDQGPQVNYSKVGGRDVVRAARFFVRCRQSHSGRMKNFPPMVRARTRRGMQDHVSAWLSCVDKLPEVHARLKRVAILNKPALDIIRKEDGPRTLFYLDPPYLHETRATTGEYDHEMQYTDHEALLELLGKIKGRFLLSGYNSTLYHDQECFFGWNRHEKSINNHAAGGKTKRMMVECVWTNF